jgi:hypothetical protein
MELRQFQETVYTSKSPYVSLERRVEIYKRGLSEAEALLRSFVEDLRVPKDEEGREIQLTCPYCKSKDPTFVELREIATVKYGGGFHIVQGKKKKVKSVAYYTCKVCSRLFYVEVAKAE